MSHKERLKVMLLLRLDRKIPYSDGSGATMAFLNRVFEEPEHSLEHSSKCEIVSLTVVNSPYQRTHLAAKK